MSAACMHGYADDRPCDRCTPTATDYFGQWEEAARHALRWQHAHDAAQARIAAALALLSDEWGGLDFTEERCAVCRRKWSKHGDVGPDHYTASDEAAARFAAIRRALTDAEAPTGTGEAS